MYDTSAIRVRAGSGGGGAISFRHEKFVPLGGPDGGDGGDGGDVVVKASSGLSTLRKYNRRRFYRAENGKRGRGRKMHGKKGSDLVIDVPVGTVVMRKAEEDGNVVVADLDNDGSSVVVARGGRGGLGNIHFTTPTNQAPQIAQEGEPGDEIDVILELRLIADAGIIGYPNCGKSTLLSTSSAAKPKVAAYPFTTLEPVLGVVDMDDRRFVLAEIPGLIDGAHLGKGLGHEFLRHITRTKVLIHVVDGSSEKPGEDYARVNAELGLFDKSLAGKPQILAINKIDLPEVRSRIKEIERLFNAVGISPLFISAATGEGVDGLMSEVFCLLDEAGNKRENEKRVSEKVFHPLPRYAGPIVRKEDDIFIVEAPQLERVIGRGAEEEVYRYVKMHLERQGVNKALRRLGIRPGDRVRCGSLEWEWTD